MPAMHDSWTTSSGLPDDIDIEIIDCHFQWSEPGKADDGTTLDEVCQAVFDCTTEEGEDISLKLVCGKDWEPGPKGLSVVSTAGKAKQRFNHNSGFGYWIRHAAELDGVSDYMGGKDATEASTWVGTKWHIMRNEEALEVRGRKIARTYPTAFLNEVKGKKGSSQAQAAKVAAKTQAKAGSNGAEDESQEDSDSGVDNSAPSGKLLNKLKAIAADNEDVESYQAAALELDEVSSNTEFTNWVLDESNYASLVS